MCEVRTELGTETRQEDGCLATIVEESLEDADGSPAAGGAWGRLGGAGAALPPSVAELLAKTDPAQLRQTSLRLQIAARDS